MGLDPRYILLQDIQEQFVDIASGLPMANGSVYFFKDDDRNVPKAVYELSGAPPNYTYAPLTQPVPLSIIGTPTNGSNDVALYYYPYDAFGNPELYYITVYNSNNVLQLTREAWPNQPIGSTPSNVSSALPENQVSNPQFASVNFNPNLPYTISIAGSGTYTVPIAPDWNLVAVTTGASTVKLVRNNIAGLSQYPTNPPYSLTVTPGANISSLQLVQTLSNNPNIWAASSSGAGGYVATSLVLGAPNTLVMVEYVPNSGTANNNLLSAANSSATPRFYTSTVQLVPADNASTPANGGQVQLILSLPNNTPTELTSIQVLGMSGDIENVQYQQTPVNRQFDQMAHYFVPQNAFKPIPSYLTGWDFKTNPAQIFGDSVSAQNTGANGSFYAWDQTILFQTNTSAVSVSRGTSTTTSGSIELTSAGSAGGIAMIQYLDTAQTRDLLTGRMAVQIQGLTSRSAGLLGKVTLWATASTLPVITGAGHPSIVATLDSTGFPATLHGTWTQVTNELLADPTFQLSTSLQTFSFNGWTLNGATLTGTATYFAIVVGFAPLTAADTININYISLCEGDIATAPAPKSADTTLRDCEVFYEKSYSSSVVGGTITAVNQNTNVMGVYTNGTNSLFNATPFTVNYRTLKRSTSATSTLYSPSAGTSGTVDTYMLQNFNAVTATGAGTVVSSYWAVTTGDKSSSYAVSANPSGANYELAGTGLGSATIQYQYIIDARLGVV